MIGNLLQRISISFSSWKILGNNYQQLPTAVPIRLIPFWVRRTTLPANPLKVRKGDIVVVDVPDIGLIVKRINLENLELSGDNPRSESSMCHVPINLRFLVGRVIASFNFPFGFKFY